MGSRKTILARHLFVVLLQTEMLLVAAELTDEYSPLSSGSRSDIDSGLVSAAITVVVILVMAFLFVVLLVYAIRRMTDNLKMGDHSLTGNFTV